MRRCGEWLYDTWRCCRPQVGAREPVLGSATESPAEACGWRAPAYAAWRDGECRALQQRFEAAARRLWPEAPPDLFDHFNAWLDDEAIDDDSAIEAQRHMLRYLKQQVCRPGRPLAERLDPETLWIEGLAQIGQMSPKAEERIETGLREARAALRCRARLSPALRALVMDALQSSDENLLAGVEARLDAHASAARQVLESEAYREGRNFVLVANTDPELASCWSEALDLSARQIFIDVQRLDAGMFARMPGLCVLYHLLSQTQRCFPYWHAPRVLSGIATPPDDFPVSLNHLPLRASAARRINRLAGIDSVDAQAALAAYRERADIRAELLSCNAASVACLLWYRFKGGTMQRVRLAGMLDAAAAAEAAAFGVAAGAASQTACGAGQDAPGKALALSTGAAACGTPPAGSRLGAEGRGVLRGAGLDSQNQAIDALDAEPARQGLAGAQFHVPLRAPIPRPRTTLVPDRDEQDLADIETVGIEP